MVTAAAQFLVGEEPLSATLTPVLPWADRMVSAFGNKVPIRQR